MIKEFIFFLFSIVNAFCMHFFWVFNISQEKIPKSTVIVLKRSQEKKYLRYDDGDCDLFSEVRLSSGDLFCLDDGDCDPDLWNCHWAERVWSVGICKLEKPESWFRQHNQLKFPPFYSSVLLTKLKAYLLFLCYY